MAALNSLTRILERFARRKLELLDKHPGFKLAAALGGLIATPVAVVAVALQAHSSCGEARRGGWYVDPQVEMVLSGTQCSLINVGPRNIAEASLAWHVYVVKEQCSIPMWSAYSPTRAADSDHELQPKERLSTTYSTDRFETQCRNASLPPWSCSIGARCQIVVECRARYHRAADLQPYAMSRFAFIAPDCDSLSNLLSGESSDPDLRREATYQRAAWRCFSRKHAELQSLARQMGEFAAASTDPLTQQQKE